MNKKLLPLFFLFVLLTSFTGPKAVINWEFTEYDFGTIKKDNPAEVIFKFKNPGMIPVIIEDVKSSCGCTVPVFPKEPILSGAEGEIKVIFDAKATGYFSKTIKVKANTEQGLSLLYIKGEVE